MKKILASIFVVGAVLCSGTAMAAHVQNIGGGRYSYTESHGNHVSGTNVYLPRTYTVNPDGLGGYYID